MGQTFKKFKLLMWKNFILQKRHKVQTTVEIVIPLLFTIILISVRAAINPKVFKEQTKYEAFDPMDPSGTRVPFGKYILYAPDDANMRTLMQGVENKFKSQLPPEINYTFEACANDGKMEETYTRLSANSDFSAKSNENPVLGGVYIDGLASNNIKYTIRFPGSLHNPTTKNDIGLKPRWATEFIYELFPLPRDRDHPEENDIDKLSKQRGGSPGYWVEGFLYLQSVLETEIIKMKAANPTDVDKYNVLLKRFPYPPFTNDKFVVALQLQLPLFVMLSFLYPFINIAKSIGYEKERRLKESMRIMGLDNWLHWTAWFTKSIIFLTISTLLIITLYKIPWFEGGTIAIMTYSDPIMLFLFFLAYLIATINLAFLVSTCSSSAGASATTAGVVFFLSYFPYFFLHPRYFKLSFQAKIIASLSSNTAMAFGARLISTAEGSGEGVHWRAINVPASPEDDISLLHLISMLLFDATVYLLAALYIEAVFPGEYGVPLPWNFPFTKWYWLDTPRVAPVHESTTVPDLTSGSVQQSDTIEKEPSGYAGIRIKGLTKVFGKKVAVKNLHLNFYENQVTALLGHNGAGKTTTMSMITGMYPPTSGTAIVNRFDIRTDMKSARKSLGLCPQHDVLFDELTVHEHLRFFCLLKGVPEEVVYAEIDRMLEVIMLNDKRHAQSKTLSGGLKRKLSVGIALIGGSEVVLLDECTSGMDPTARRSTWDLISNEKAGRTIVLSTHFMDEADLLGDRIAIMADGQVQCCGSSLFLKKKYGGGYRLIIVKTINCNVDNITALLQKRIPEVTVNQDIGAELTYSLPDEKSSLFPEMFEELEKRKVELGIDSYGCSITEMEEVFMRVGEQVEKDQATQSLHSIGLKGNAPESTSVMSTASEKDGSLKSVNDAKSGHSKTVANFSEPNKHDSAMTVSAVSVKNLEKSVQDFVSSHSQHKRNMGRRLLLQQFRAMLVKRWLYFCRNKILVISQMFIPVLYLTIALIMLATLPKLEKPKPRTIGLWSYTRLKSTETLCKCRGSDICQKYKTFVQKHSMITCDMTKDFDDFILEKYKKSIPEVNYKYIIGFERSITKGREILTGYFNGQPFHTPPLALNLISNTILREVTGNINFNMTVTNHPFEFLSRDKVEDLIETGNEGYSIGFNISFGMSFLSASFVLFLIKERETKSKHLQHVSGVKFPIFWIAHYIFDVIYYIISVLLVMITLLLFNQKDFGCRADGAYNKNCKQGIRMQGYLFILLMTYGMSIIPLMYLFSFLFTVPSSGYTRTAFFNLLTGIATLITMFIMQLKAIGLEELSDTLEWVFMIFPNFDLGYSIGLLTSNLRLHKECKPALETINKAYKAALETINKTYKAALGANLNACIIYPKFTCCTIYPYGYFDWHSPGILRHLVYMIVVGITSFVILFMIEAHIFRKISFMIEVKMFAKSASLQQYTDEANEDDDVAAENARIRQTYLPVLFQTENMILYDLTKVYGLLGVNGAGKTTTFKMLTGDIMITDGSAYVASKSVRTQIKDVHQKLGYCPQFDALIPELTGRATIELIARLRGIPESHIPYLVYFLGESLIFSQHMDKPCGTYSGGNRRKLSTSLALIGNPPLVCLDEPTTGMDPVARRHLWNAVISMRKCGTSVVLTSHSMEECEALCTRLAIMVNGKFRCLGSSQHLKSKYGQGYTVIAQLQSKLDEMNTPRVNYVTGVRRDSIEEKRIKWEKELEPLRDFIEQSFSGCRLRESHPGYVHYHVPEQEGLTWGKIFGQMEDAKVRFQLEAYSVGQTTLEQVFLRFTKEQIEPGS